MVAYFKLTALKGKILQTLGRLLPPILKAGAFALAAGSFMPQPSLSSMGKIREQVMQYVESLRTLEATFMEIGPQRKARGKLFLKRPAEGARTEYGKLKFLYDDPVPLVVTSQKGIVHVFNTQAHTEETTPLSSTPLFVFMRSHVSLTGVAVEKGLFVKDDEIHWVLAPADTPDGSQAHQLTLIFSATSPTTLVGWIIEDPTGQETAVTLENVKGGHPLPDSVFDKPNMVNKPTNLDKPSLKGSSR